MKYILMLVCILLANICLAQNFEGVIVQQVEDFKQGSSTELTWVISGDKAVIELKYDTKDGPVTMVLLPLENGEFAFFNKQRSTTGPNYYFVGSEGDDLGVYKMINPRSSTQLEGYTVSEYVFKSAGEESQVWFTEDLAIDFQKIVEQFNSSSYFTQFEGLPSSGFVLQMIAKSGGAITTTIDLVQVLERVIDPSYFTIPSGYVKYDQNAQ